MKVLKEWIERVNLLAGLKLKRCFLGHFEKHFSCNRQTKDLMGKKLDFFYLGTPKTALLIRNLPIDFRNLGIFSNKQVHSFQLPKESRGDLLVLLGSLSLLAYFTIFMSLCLLPKDSPDISRIYGSHFGWRVKYNDPKKTNFVNELMEVWRILSTYILLRNNISAINMRISKLVGLSFFYLFLKHC